jgi:hypothetical protein
MFDLVAKSCAVIESRVRGQKNSWTDAEELAAGYCIDRVRYSQRTVLTVHTMRTWRSNDLYRTGEDGRGRGYGKSGAALGTPLRSSLRGNVNVYDLGPSRYHNKHAPLKWTHVRHTRDGRLSLPH